MDDKKQIEIYNKLTDMYVKLIGEVYDDIEQFAKDNQFKYSTIKVIPATALRQVVRSRRSEILAQIRKLKL